RSLRIDGEAVDVPCVARNPMAGANSRIHALEHARLSPSASCATPRYHGTQEQNGINSQRCSGPLGSGETETIRPEGARTGSTRVFVSSGRTVENPGSGSRTREAGANAGCPSLWLLSLRTS